MPSTAGPARGTHAYVDQPGLFGLSGLEQLELFASGGAPIPPLQHLTGLAIAEAGAGSSTWSMPASPWWRTATGTVPRLTAAEEGSAVCTMPASPWFATGFGTFYGGAVALLADAALSAAVTSTLPPAPSFGPLNLKVDFLRPVNPDGRDLVASATVVRRGRTIAVTTAGIDDADGNTVAIAAGSAMILEDHPWPAAEGDEPPG